MIKLHGDFYLSADTRQFILITKGISQKGKTKGEEVVLGYKYFPSLELLFRTAFEKILFDVLSDQDMETIHSFKEKYVSFITELNDISLRIGTASSLYQKMVDKKTVSIEDTK